MRANAIRRGGSTQGEWPIVADGEFSSFWPPDYRATQVARWIVEDGAGRLAFGRPGRQVRDT